jgi:glycyl-tRNA synthetase beta chain
MPEFFLELFSEEIPARMQAGGLKLVIESLQGALAEFLESPKAVSGFYGPRRIAVIADVKAEVTSKPKAEKGPRISAPEQALAGFLRKHNVSRDALQQEGDFWVLDRPAVTKSVAREIADILPIIIRSSPWPKSMRWGGTSSLTWVRPLRRITALLDGEVIPFDLREGVDDGHGLAASNLSEGHRFLSPGAFTVTSAAQWQQELRARHVIVDAAERRRIVAEGIAALAAERQCSIVEDPGLLEEVAGLVEYPVPLLGHIGAEFMDLPAEVMQVSMRVNQRYFALRHADGTAAPYFAFAANIAAPDGGATIIAGNERVLRARFSDARHFWDLDRTRTLASRVAALDAITFHAKLGSQGDRVRRIVRLAGIIAPLVGADPTHAERAAHLAKADLTTGMVGEFPELQGVMGSYYATNDGEPANVAAAVRDHYLPKGQGDAVPTEPVSVAVALADKLDMLAEFFRIGERPTGSGDPFALRRAALGVIRIIREKQIRLRLGEFLVRNTEIGSTSELLEFLVDRLRVQLRAEGARYDVLNAVLPGNLDYDLVLLLARTEAVTAMVTTEDGKNLLAAAKRAANILRIEDKKDGPHEGPPDHDMFAIPEERILATALDSVAPRVAFAIGQEHFAIAMTELASLRAPLDAFFATVTVNDDRPDIRRNRLKLLAQVRAAMQLVADFSKIDG